MSKDLSGLRVSHKPTTPLPFCRGQWSAWRAALSKSDWDFSVSIWQLLFLLLPVLPETVPAQQCQAFSWNSHRFCWNSEHTVCRAMWAVVDLVCQSGFLQGSDSVAYLDTPGDRLPRPMDFSHPWDAWSMCWVGFHQPILYILYSLLQILYVACHVNQWGIPS